MPKHEALKATWIETAVTQRLIEASEAELILSAAGAEDSGIEQVVLTRFADDLERLGALQALLAKLEQEADFRATSTGDVTETIGTETIGPKSRRTSPKKQRQPEPPSGTQILADSQQQDPTLAKGSCLNASDSTKHTGRSNANKSTQRKTASKRSSSAPRPDSRDRFSPQLTQQLDDLRKGSERYQPLDEIGRGGCGVVTQALDRQLQRNVVVKRIIERDGISDEVVQRFINEAQITGQLEHPGIVPIYEVGVDDQGLPFYAMKQVRGVTLADRISSLRSMPKGREREVTLRQLIDRFRDVCQTLAFAHQSGVIHRDLKPANIMIGEFGETILLDWGLARRVKTPCKPDSNVQETLQAGRPDSKQTAKEPASGQAKSGLSRGSASSDMTRQGAVLGTATYMAPEQAQGRNDCVNQQSDVFSLGVILYEILSGESPFRTDSLEGTLIRVAKCEFRPLREVAPTVPRPLAAICQCAMQADPKSRYVDARAMAADLESYLAGGRTSVYREKIWERFDRIANNNSTLFRAIFVGCLLVTTTALVAVGQIMQAHREERYARTVAVDARAKAEFALENEKSARERTHEQLTASREAADTWLIDLSGYLEFYPGLESIRSDLIEQGIHHYEGLLEDASQERARLLSLAKSAQSESVDSVRASELQRAETDIVAFHLRLGDLFRLSGDGPSSREHYGAAEQAAQESLELNDTSGGPHSREIQLSNALIGSAILSIELPAKDPLSANAPTPASGNAALSNGSAATDRAIRLAQAALAQNPASQDARNALCRARLVAARLAMKTSDWAAAEKLLYEALPDAEILVQQQPSARFMKLKCSILEDRARVLYRSGQYGKAANSANELISFYERCLEASPNRPDILESRSLAKSLLGSCRLAGTDIQPAVEAYHRAEEDLEQAWELLYGEQFYRENRAVLAANLSEAYSLAGKKSKADDFLHQAVEQLRWLVRFDGVTADRIYRLSRCYLALAHLGVEQQSDDAGEWLRLNRVLIDHLLEQRQPVADQLNLKQLVLEGQLAMNEGRLESAVALFRQAVLSPPSPDVAQSEESSLQNAKAKLFLARIEDSLALDYRSEQRQNALSTIQQVTQGDSDLIAHDAFAFLVELFCESRGIGESDPGKACALALNWVSRFPHSPEAWYWLAEAHYLQEQYADADTALAKAIKLRSGESTVEDVLLQAAIASARNPASSAHHRESALHRHADSKSNSLHRVFLIELLTPTAEE